ncbi:MAG: MFS transporter [Pseudomonadota bacterium]
MSNSSTVTEPLEPAQGGAKTPTVRRVLAAGAIGNVLEWFDFALYGYLAQYIASSFFPSSDPLSSLLAVYGAFAAGYLARPLGAMIFGQIGDTIGRKNVLTLSVTLMGVSTVSMAFLPTFDQVGPLAGVLLVVLRVLQGISVGGEFTGSFVFLAENAPKGRRGLFTSTSNFGCVVGFLLGSGLAALLSAIFSEAQITDGIWRFAFLSGIIIMIIGLILRRSLTVPERLDKYEHGLSPVLAAFRFHWKDILRIAGLALSANVGFYIMFVFAVSYLTDEMHISTSKAMDINTAAIILLALIVPVGGWLSDRWGRKPVLLTFNFLLLVGAYPLFLLVHHQAAWLIFLGQAGFAVLVGILFGVNPATMAEIAPKAVRVSVLSIGYSLALAIFGGTAPAVATFLVERTSNDMSPAYYMAGFAVIAIITTLTFTENSKRDIL